MDKIKHTVVQSAASLSGMRAGILKEVREEKGQYGYSDVVNACGLSYARLYSEIEQCHEENIFVIEVGQMDTAYTACSRKISVLQSIGRTSGRLC